MRIVRINRVGSLLAACVLPLSVLAGACGGDDDAGEAAPVPDGVESTRADTAPDDSAAETEPDDSAADGASDDSAADGGDMGADGSGGTVRIAYDLVGGRRGGVTLNPIESFTTGSSNDLQLWQAIYGALFRPEPDGGMAPDLAESFDLVDVNTLEIRLRPDVMMPDGSTLDAEMVKTQLDSNLATQDDPEPPRMIRPQFYDLESVEVVDDLTVRLNIPTGTAAGWGQLFLGAGETIIVPEGTDFSQPAGAGPLRVVEYLPEQSMALEKNPDYWDADSIHFDRLELVSAPDTDAWLAALNAGQADWARLHAETSNSVNEDLEIHSTASGWYLSAATFCREAAPFDDPLVRQAISLSINKEQLNEVLLDGLGEPATGLWPEGHLYHNPDSAAAAKYLTYDPERARQLLDDAGYGDGLSFEALYFPFAHMPEAATIVQQQLAEVGIEMEIVNSTNPSEDFSTNKIAPASFSPIVLPGVERMLRYTAEEGIQNPCGYDDPELNALNAELQSVRADSEEAVQIWYEIQELIIGDMLDSFMFFQPAMGGYDPERLHGGITIPNYQAFFAEIRTLDVVGE